MKKYNKHWASYLAITFFGMFVVYAFTKIGSVNSERKEVPLGGLADIKEVKSLEPSVEVGQEWMVLFNDKNPYEKTDTVIRCVIDVKGDYVLYVQNDKDTLNMEVYWFLVSANLIE